MKTTRTVSLKTSIIILCSYILLISIVGFAISTLFSKTDGIAGNLIEDYKSILRDDPENAEVHAKLADLYVEVADEYPDENFLDEAKEEYVKAIQLFPENIDYKYSLASLLHTLGNENEAVKEYKKILKIEPFSTLANYEMATYYSTKKEYEKAIVHFERCLKMEPSAANVYFGLGGIYEKQGKKDLALVMYENVRKYDPNFVGITEKIEEILKQN